MVHFSAPVGEIEAIDLFAKARAGDAAAAEKVRDLIAAGGGTSESATSADRPPRQLIRTTSGADPVLIAGVTEKANAHRRELLGPNPSALDDLLACRVVNGWVALHALELELAFRTPRPTGASASTSTAL